MKVNDCPSISGLAQVVKGLLGLDIEYITGVLAKVLDAEYLGCLLSLELPYVALRVDDTYF